MGFLIDCLVKIKFVTYKGSEIDQNVALMRFMVLIEAALYLKFFNFGMQQRSIKLIQNIKESFKCIMSPPRMAV